MMGRFITWNGTNRRAMIREGMDNLPVGIAFAKPDGIVVFCNHMMNRVSSLLIGAELQNAKEFWDETERHGEQTKNKAYILRMGDGSVWLLTRREHRVRKGTIYEITAQDVAERMRLIDRIDEDNRILASVGNRLQKYSENALELARRRELLERKQHTHDELGRLLGATRHYLTGGNVNSGELWQRWHINAALMLEEARLPAEEDLTACLRRTAEAVGVTLRLTGDEPRDDRVEELMLAAGGECLANLLRHTKGNTLYISVANRGREDILSFSDNGGVLEGEITEGGGLLALRRKTEDIGGTMTVVSQPNYRLTLTIPLKGGNGYVSNFNRRG